jgi:hypothetical protein
VKYTEKPGSVFATAFGVRARPRAAFVKCTVDLKRYEGVSHPESAAREKVERVVPKALAKLPRLRRLIFAPPADHFPIVLRTSRSTSHFKPNRTITSVRSRLCLDDIGNWDWSHLRGTLAAGSNRMYSHSSQ